MPARQCRRRQRHRENENEWQLVENGEDSEGDLDSFYVEKFYVERGPVSTSGLRPDPGGAAIHDVHSERGRREEGLGSHAVQGRREGQPGLMSAPVWITETGHRWHQKTDEWCLRNARGVVLVARCTAESLGKTRCGVCG